MTRRTPHKSHSALVYNIKNTSRLAKWDAFRISFEVYLGIVCRN